MQKALLVAALVLTLAACNEDDGEAPDETATEGETATETAPATEGTGN